jgi:glycosyltransferase involved in cell wall biosynthesis
MMILKAGFDRFLGIRGGLHGRQLFPEQWYRGVHEMICPSIYGEPSRVQFEAQACGCPVVTWGSDPYGDSYANLFAKPFDVADLAECLAKLYDQIRANPLKVHEETRMIAEQHFDMKRMAAQVVAILRKVQEGG